MKLEELAQAIAMDLDGTLARFGGSRALLLRFLKKFPQDATYAALRTAVESGSWTEVERTAHTLKGVAANLGLERISSGSGALVQAVRSGAQEDVPQLFTALAADYAAAETAIAALEE